MLTRKGIPIQRLRKTLILKSTSDGILQNAIGFLPAARLLRLLLFSCEELTEIALRLRDRVDLDPQRRDRLVGVGLSNLRDSEDTVARAHLFRVEHQARRGFSLVTANRLFCHRGGLFEVRTRDRRKLHRHLSMSQSNLQFKNCHLPPERIP